MRDETKLVHLGSAPADNHGSVNPPVHHTSTVIFPSVAAMKDATEAVIVRREQAPFYGRRGTPTLWSLENALAELEGGHRAFLFPSGVAAIAVALQGFLSPGDHLLMADNVYAPGRHFAVSTLKRFGIATTFFDPAIGVGISALIRPETKVVFLEAPGSHTFEISDVPAIAEAAHRAGAIVMFDNTWATPLFFKSFAHGVDVSIHAATKYIVGHADAMLGVAIANERAFVALHDAARGYGQTAGPDDVYLALRGFRSMGARLARHQETALALADWLKGRPEVKRVLHPGLPGDPSHALWKRDFTGSSGLFGVVLKPTSPAQLSAFVDHLELFGIGFSWGGFESLALPYWPAKERSAVPWVEDGQLIRIHAGLDALDDLKADLAEGFKRWVAAA